MNVFHNADSEDINTLVDIATQNLLTLAKHSILNLLVALLSASIDPYLMRESASHIIMLSFSGTKSVEQI